MINKDKAFEKILWDLFSQQDSYEKTKYRMLRIRMLMLEHPCFQALSAREQFAICGTALCIALETSTKDLRLLSLFGNKTQYFHHSIDEGFKAPEAINIHSKNKLKCLPNKL